MLSPELWRMSTPTHTLSKIFFLNFFKTEKSPFAPSSGFTQQLGHLFFCSQTLLSNFDFVEDYNPQSETDAEGNILSKKFQKIIKKDVGRLGLCFAPLNDTLHPAII